MGYLNLSFFRRSLRRLVGSRLGLVANKLQSLNHTRLFLFVGHAIFFWSSVLQSVVQSTQVVVAQHGAEMVGTLVEETLR